MMIPAPPTVFVCNLKAIPADRRPRYNELTRKLRAAMTSRIDIAAGYAYTFAKVPMVEAAEWAEFERLCCPFLTIQLSTSGSRPGWTMTLTGPAGVKPLLDEEFPYQKRQF